jgi:lipopolysaccharide export system permease protein
MQHRLVTRYVGKQVLLAILMVLAVILGLDILAAVIDETGELEGSYTFGQSIIYILMTIPRRINDYLPYAALVGCLAGLGGLASNSELTVMRAAGISTKRLVWIVMRPAMLVMILGVLLSEYVAPVTEQIAHSNRQYLISGDKVSSAKGGVWNREGNEFMHFNSVQPNGVVFGIMLYNFDDERNLTKAVAAKRASYQDGSYWVLENGAETTFRGDKTSSQSFSTLRWNTSLSPKLLNVVSMRPRYLSISDLYSYVEYRRAQDLDSGEFVLEFWKKVLQPLGTASLVLIAISFIFGPLREVTMGYRIFTGVMVGVVFRTVQNLLGPASLVFSFPPWQAVAIPIIICAIAGFYMLRKA